LGSHETLALFKRAEGRDVSGRFAPEAFCEVSVQVAKPCFATNRKIKGGAAPLVAPGFSLVTMRSPSTVQHTLACGKSATTTSRLPKQRTKKKKERKEKKKALVDYLARHHSQRDNGSTTADPRHCAGSNGDIPCPFDTAVLRLASARLTSIARCRGQEWGCVSD